jgi:hypothetical protein
MADTPPKGDPDNLSRLHSAFLSDEGTGPLSTCGHCYGALAAGSGQLRSFIETSYQPPAICDYVLRLPMADGAKGFGPRSILMAAL